MAVVHIGNEQLLNEKKIKRLLGTFNNSHTDSVFLFTPEFQNEISKVQEGCEESVYADAKGS
jgi:hypothetical protein